MASITAKLIPIPFCKSGNTHYLSTAVSLTLSGGTTLADFPLIQNWPSLVDDWFAQGDFELAINNVPIAGPLQLMDQDFPGQTEGKAIPLAATEAIWTALMQPNRPVASSASAFLAGIQHVELGRNDQFIQEITTAYTDQLKMQGGLVVNRGLDTRANSWLAHIEKLEAVLKKQTAFHRDTANALQQQDTDNLAEFHNLMASLGDETILLRGFRLILDLKFEAAGLPRGTVSLRFKGSPKDGLSFESPQVPFDPNTFDILTEGNSPISDRCLRLPGSQTAMEDQSSHFYLHDLDPFAVGYAIKETLIKAKNGAANLRSDRLPPLQSQGLGVSTVRKETDVQKYSAQALQNNDYYLDNLTLGYRVDVFTNNKWYSLSKRNVSYCVAGSTDAATINWQDEGASSENVTHTKEEELEGIYVPDALFRWDGWSLVAPRLEEWDELQDEKENQQQLEFPRIETRTRVTPGTLPRLRFGEKYRFRIRVVDICGNSKLFDPNAPAEAGSKEIAYFRQEPLPSPSVTGVYALSYNPATNPSSRINQCIKGESAQLMVVRSNESSRDTEFNPYSARYIAAPRVSQKFCETHGKFDSEQGLSNSLKTRNQIADSFREEETSTDVYNPYDPALPGERYIRYLPDPAVAGFTIRLMHSIDGIDEGKVHENLKAYFRKRPRNWPVLKKWAIVLRPGKFNSIEGPNEYPVPHLIVNLKKGEHLSLELKSMIDLDYLKIFGVDYRITDPREARVVLDSISESLNRQIISSSVIELVHAVQQPLFAPSILSMQPSRKPDVVQPSDLLSTSETILINHRFPGKTSNRLELFAEWTDWHDKPGEQVVKTDTAKFVQQIELPAGTVDHDNAKSTAVHEFGDTRHRDVYYKLVATSRFKDFFPEKDVHTERIFTKESKEHFVNILSSKSPAPLGIIGINLLNKFSGKDGNIKKSTVYRLLFQRGNMYDQGAGTKIAVVVERSESAPLATPINQLLSVSGSDLIGSTRTEHRLQLKDLTNKAGVATSVKLQELEHNVDLALFEPLLHSKKSATTGEMEIDAWYIDIELDDRIVNDLTFIRFSVAKYQPNSIAGAHLSLTTQTLFIASASGKDVQLISRGSQYRLVLKDNAFIKNPRAYRKQVVAFTQFNEETRPNRDSMAWEHKDVIMNGQHVDNIPLVFNAQTGQWESAEFQPTYATNVRAVVLEYRIFDYDKDTLLGDESSNYKEDPITLENPAKKLVDMHTIVIHDLNPKIQ